VGVDAAYQHYWRKRLLQRSLFLRRGEQYRLLLGSGADKLQPRCVHRQQLDLESVWIAQYIGAEFLYGWAMEQNGLKANAPRIQFSAKYSFVKVDPDQN
jgi:hypothetical protein